MPVLHQCYEPLFDIVRGDTQLVRYFFRLPIDPGAVE